MLLQCIIIIYEHFSAINATSKRLDACTIALNCLQPSA